MYPQCPRQIIVMGVSGCGKSTVGSALAETLGGTFADGDDFHSATNRARMRAGVPLSDADRQPWLAELNAWLRENDHTGAKPSVLACSALKTAYRETLARGLEACAFLFLKADSQTLEIRMKQRPAHFMPVALLRSQLDTLEPPGAETLTLDAGQPVHRIVSEAVRAFGFTPGNTPGRS